LISDDKNIIQVERKIPTNTGMEMTMTERKNSGRIEPQTEEGKYSNKLLPALLCLHSSINILLTGPLLRYVLDNKFS